MDKFNIHKWQRKALLSENKRYGFHPLHTEERYESYGTELQRLIKKYDDDTLEYIVDHLYHKLVNDKHLAEDTTLEQADINADFDVEELSQALESEFDEEIEAYIQRGKGGMLKDLVTAIELKTGIDIPDNEAEAQQISKEDLLTLGKTLQDLNTPLEERKFRPPTAGDIVGTLGLLSTVLGAASNVTVPGSGIAPAVLGIFLMRLGIYLDSKDTDLDDN